MKNITSKIRNARNSKGFSQEYMAETLGISQRQYGRLENGESQMNLQYLEKISNELDIRLEDLFTNEITQENHNQSGGLANSGHIIVNEFSEKLIEQYERRLIEKNDQISLL
jgi:transcriptional regulator with XRE-family HTH domain